MRASIHANDDLFSRGLVESYTSRRRFVRRKWLADEVDALLSKPSCRFVLLTAEPGAGKSTFVAQLAHDHPRRPVYFIRRDQRSVLRDASAASFLLHTGFQLAALYPELFTAERVRVGVEQSAGEVGETGEMIGAKIDRLLTSPFYQVVVEVRQQVTQSRGRVTGLQVREVVADPRLVSLSDLQEMALLNPARSLLAERPDERIIILVDALDEIRYHAAPRHGPSAGEWTLLDWLASAPALPPNVRFVLTSRPHDNLLRNFADKQRQSLESLVISPTDDRVRDELREYVGRLVRRREVKAALRRDQRAAADFAAEALAKADGNIGYLDALARGMDNALRRGDTEALVELLSLRGLPEDLSGLYTFFLHQIEVRVQGQSVTAEEAGGGRTHYLPAWPAVYQNVLGALAVAFEPLTLLQIKGLGGVEAGAGYVAEALDWLRQFLDVRDGRFSLYHATLPEFLTDPARLAQEPSLYANPSLSHRRAAAHYLKIHQGDWEGCDAYGLRHLVSHLQLGGLHAELLSLVGEPTWYDAKRALDPSDSAFISDVSRGWAGARALNRAAALGGRRAEFVSGEARCALLISSVNSVSQEMPPALLSALVKYAPGWSYREALAAARQNPDPWRKVLSLAALLPLLPAHIGRRVAQESLNEAAKIDEPVTRARARLAVAAQLPRAARRAAERAAVAAALDEKSEWQRADTLAGIAGLVPRLMLPDFIEAAKKFERADNAERVLVSISPRLPARLLREALRAGLADAACVPAALAAHARLLLEVRRHPILKRALEEVPALKEGYWQEKAIKSLLPHLPDSLLGEAFAVARRLFDQYPVYREGALAAVAERFADAGDLERALDAAELIQTGWVKVRALAPLAPRLSGALWARALECVREIGVEYANRYWKAEALGLLLHVAPPGERDALIAEALALREIRDADERATTLVALSRFLPEGCRREAFAAARQIKDDSRKTQAFANIAPCLPEDLLREAYGLAIRLSEDRYEARALTALAPRLPEDLLASAVGDARRLNDLNDAEKAALLCALAPRLSGPPLNAALSQVKSMSDQHARLDVLEALLPRFNEQRSRATFDEIKGLNEGHPIMRAHIMAVAVRGLPEVERSAAVDDLLAVLGEVAEEAWGDPARAAITQAFGSAGRHEEALRTAGRIRDEATRSRVVAGLTPSLPEDLLESAVRVAELMQREWPARLALLSALSTRMPQRDLFADALEVARKVADMENSDRAEVAGQVLIPLLHHLPAVRRADTLALAVACVREIGSHHERRRVLNELSDLLLDNLSLAPVLQLYELWDDTLQAFAGERREDALAALSSMSPLVVALGGVSAAEETFAAVLEAGRRWP